jgi:hypothetical protein
VLYMVLSKAMGAKANYPAVDAEVAA